MSILSHIGSPAVVEIESVEIENFKNVGCGKIDFSAGRDGGADVVGVYGPNGSGKTALMDAIDTLKQVLTGKSLSAEIADKISVGHDHSHFSWTFDLRPTEGQPPAKITYSFDIAHGGGAYADGMLPAGSSARCHVINETVSVASRKNGRAVKRSLVDTAKGDGVSPKQQFRDLTGGGGVRVKTQLQEHRKVAWREGRSFVFSGEFMNLICEKSRDREAVEILGQLHFYAMSSLFVVSARHSSLPVLDVQTLLFSEVGHQSGAAGSCLLPVDGDIDIPAGFYGFLEERLRNVSFLLDRIVPGQQVELKVNKEYKDKSNAKRYNVEVMSLCDGNMFPFRYESDGIKKLIAVLELLAGVYARPGITLAIDELDSGVFEYLLGDLMRIIAEEGEGQLFFTSHNLYPMELLKPGNVVLTTTDPQHRYTRLKGIKENNNIRKFYMRELFLKNSVPLLYKPADNSRIAAAFQRIGAGS